MTKIVATIGPASQDLATLTFFRQHSVQIARLNFSHNSAEWHIETGRKCRAVGFELMVDLAGPKILLGFLSTDKTMINTGDTIIIEKQNPNHTYPYLQQDLQVLPCQFHIEEFVKPGQPILIDDGKISCEVTKVSDQRVYCRVNHGGVVKSNKGVNMPLSDIEIDFLVDRDRDFLSQVLPAIRPEYVAPSFVKTIKDLEKLKAFIQEILKQQQINDYFPKVCTKIEMGEAVKPENLEAIIQASDMIMIARGDLALETLPNHIKVPFYQEKIKRLCQKHKKPFIVATQILETMTDNPVPTRAEMSDLYRAVCLDNADFVMLSGESAGGKFPTKCVQIMHDMIHLSKNFIETIINP